ncbi:hypothetical protein EVC62_12450 [Salinicola endophyticus]|uniref:Uncharacterized protein n=1 Tax=Salinicola endophyticus TaxID=1949083 RepID=A0ABY8FQU0_9GAMM|nr:MULTISPECIES: hypothetical protein [Salinicola]WFF42249.1 hypothetical protein EVC62_12450 [Salinicola endophyticus]
MHNVYVPVVGILLVFGAIFGYQAFNDSQVDDNVAQLIATQRGVEKVEVKDLDSVQKGYGLCGQYRVAGETAYAPFYYSQVDDRVTLDTQAKSYQKYCSR